MQTLVLSPAASATPAAPNYFASCGSADPLAHSGVLCRDCGHCISDGRAPWCGAPELRSPVDGRPETICSVARSARLGWCGPEARLFSARALGTQSSCDSLLSSPVSSRANASPAASDIAATQDATPAAPNYFFTSGHADFLTSPAGRRFQAVLVDADEKHLAATALEGLFLNANGAVTEPWYLKGDGWAAATARVALVDCAGFTTFYAHRAFTAGNAPFWLGTESRRDELGRTWTRDVTLVVDNFGDLVEVSQ